jgi:hypothetical protein
MPKPSVLQQLHLASITTAVIVGVLRPVMYLMPCLLAIIIRATNVERSLFVRSSLLLCNNSIALIDNTQLSLYMGYTRKVSYSHYSHIQLYKCIRVLCSSGSLCSSSHVRPTHSCGIMLLASSSVRRSY